MNWQPPTLRDCKIAHTAPTTIDSPLDFMRAHLADDALVVVESTDTVKVVRLTALKIDDRTLHLHGFSKTKKSQARAARAGWASKSWCADAVRECAAGEAGSTDAKARAGHHLCLGKVSTTGEGTSTLSEARIKPYTLPIAIALDNGASVSFIDYLTSDDTGRLNCTAHRVVEIGESNNSEEKL